MNQIGKYPTLLQWIADNLKEYHNASDYLIDHGEGYRKTGLGIRLKADTSRLLTIGSTVDDFGYMQLIAEASTEYSYHFQCFNNDQQVGYIELTPSFSYPHFQYKYYNTLVGSNWEFSINWYECLRRLTIEKMGDIVTRF